MIEREKLEKMKKNLLLNIIQDTFKEDIRKTVEDGDWKDISELDRIIDIKLRYFIETRDAISEFYNQRIYE